MSFTIRKKLITTRSSKYDKCELLDYLNDKSGLSQYGFERFKGDVIPYYEYDNSYPDEKTRQVNEVSDYTKALDEVKTLYNTEKAVIFTLNSNGHDKSKNTFKNSYHFRIRGVGYYKFNGQIQLTTNCDPAVYCSEQNLRLPCKSKRAVSKKEKGNRPLTPFQFKDGKIKNLKPNKYDVMNYIVQNIEDEVLIDIGENKKSDKIEKTMIGFNVDLTFITTLLDCLDDDRWVDWGKWKDLLMCLNNVAASQGINSGDMLEIANEYSREKGDGKYAEGCCDKFFTGVFPPNKNLNIGSLRFWAKEDAGSVYEKLLPKFAKISITADENKNWKALTKAKKRPRKYYYSDYLDFDGKKDCKTEDIYQYLNDSIVHIANCGVHEIYTVNKLPDESLKFQIIDNRSKLNLFRGIDDVHFQIDGENKSMSTFFTYHYRKNAYKFQDFHPYLIDDPTPESVFNMFQGFKISYNPDHKVNKNNVKLFLHHVKEIICDGIEEDYLYLMKYIRHMFEKPADKVGVLLLFQSDQQGAGKNMFLNMILNIIGESLVYKAKCIEDICSRFNYHLQSKLVIQGDEIANFSGFKVSDKLKAAITETTISVEPKGKDIYNIKSCERYLLTSNNKNPIRVEMSDRRIKAFRCSNKMIGDTKYFTELHKQVESVEHQTDVFHWILQNPEWDLKTWNKSDLGCSAYKDELLAGSLENPIEFVLEKARSFHESETPIADRFLSTKNMYNAYVEWCEGNGEKKQSKKVFELTTKQILTKVRMKVGTARPHGYLITTDGIQDKYRTMSNNPNWLLIEEDDMEEIRQSDDEGEDLGPL